MTLSPIIQRLQAHQARAQRMLTPGRTDRGGDVAPVRRLSPVMAGLGGTKYRDNLSAFKFVKKERLGGLRPDSINHLGRGLPARLEGIRSLLRLKPVTVNQGGIWPELERTLPGLAPESGPEPTPDSGVLRQGSIIQKFQTTPKPGQSLESFKQQVESRVPRPPAPPGASRKTGGPAPTARLYSRVEEVTRRKPEPPAAPAPEPPTGSPTPPAASSPASTPGAVQRQPDVPSEAPEAPRAASRESAVAPVPQLLPDLPTPPAAPGAVQRQPDVEDAPHTPPEAPLPAPLVRPASAEITSLARAQIPSAVPAPRTTEGTPVPRALPAVVRAKDSAPAAQKAPEKRLLSQPRTQAAPRVAPGATLTKAGATLSPVVQRTIAAPARPKQVPAPRLPVAQRALAQTVQRRPDAPEASMPQTPDFLAGEGLQPGALQKTQSVQEPPAAPLPVSPAPLADDSPLQARLARRKSAPQSVRLASRTESTPPLVAPRPTMLPPARLARTAPGMSPLSIAVAPEPGELPPPGPVAPVQRPKPQGMLEKMPVDAYPSTSGLPAMPVARPFGLAAPLPGGQPQRPTPAEAMPGILPPVSPAPTTAPASLPVRAGASAVAQGGTVQRALGSALSAISDEDQAPARQSPAPASALPSLDELAEAVLPLVKRILETEAERTRGWPR